MSNPKPRAEIALALGLTPCQVRHAEAVALRKLLRAWRSVGADASDIELLREVLAEVMGGGGQSVWTIRTNRRR